MSSILLKTPKIQHHHLPVAAVVKGAYNSSAPTYHRTSSSIKRRSSRVYILEKPFPSPLDTNGYMIETTQGSSED
ncbi:hypothetical protein [Candidatus Uabimicrobium amorphum]|uniref:hypothetical protein n=1 Tax=Uabimicrobium amorphum TaxID=2596890 RepID=UPI00125ED751|nr:hypothetical protein [Candidatus Uabimicrobium amorphum]